ncbi:MAG: nuclear transport factor 2 family protein [Saprospiraceae bacterium]|nr:nuclear transport factor 2 family protein [Saprospiraceae bacterium]MBK9220615.1 nuclear transport factor 2 family protein [Saprospiraceae bacterium]MBK9722537.1 nuclear transport factor 2 family protein [Saprospiraceae bacterium]
MGYLEKLVFNNIRRIFILLVLLTNLQVFLNGQECIILESLVKDFNNTLISRDAKQLDKLVHSDLTYGHSNGWVENKNEFLINNQSKYLIYEKIEMDSLQIHCFDKLAIVRFHALHDIILNGKIISLKLHVCQTWIKTKGKWKLLARQSTKLS